MTRDDVIQKLTDEGFVLRYVDVAGYTIVEHRGEPVGMLYDTHVCIAKYYPSLNPDGVSTYYADAKKTIIMYSHSMSEVDMAIQWLLESPNRIDTEKRKKRIDTIRRYFDDRRSASLDDRRSASLDERRIPASPARPILSSYMGSARLYHPRHSTHTDEDSTT